MIYTLPIYAYLTDWCILCTESCILHVTYLVTAVSCHHVCQWRIRRSRSPTLPEMPETALEELVLAATPAGWDLVALSNEYEVSGPETDKRKRVTRKADGKLTRLVNLGGSWHERLTLLVTHFSLPILAYSFQGHGQSAGCDEWTAGCCSIAVSTFDTAIKSLSSLCLQCGASRRTCP